jgi:PAS domain S-box-containing protein
MESTAEIKRLQSCINDLISVLALPAIWSGSESSQILGTLLESLQTMLRLDFAYARLGDASGGPPIEVVRSADHRFSSVQSQQLGQALDRWLTGDQTASRNVVPDLAGEGEVSIVSFSLGLQHEGGVLVAGSRRADFPTEVERLLLRVAANQAGIGLQEARRSGEQKRIAEVLEQRVAERTRLLTAVNDELRRSEAYLAEAQRLSHTGSWALSANSKIAAYWSEEDFRIWGFDPQKGFPDRDMVFQRIHPEDVGRVNEKSLMALRERTDYTDEFRIVLPDGEVRHIQALAHPVLSASGEIAEYVGTHVDVTERKRAEEAQLRLAAIVASSDDAIISKTLGGIITSWNASAERTFGYTAEEALGRPITILIPPDRQDEESQIIESLRRGESVHHFETVRLRKDGREIHVSLAISPIKDTDGQIIGASKIARDITERHQARAALERAYDEIKKSEDRLRLVIDTIPGMVWRGLPDGTFDFINQPWLTYLGCSWEELSARGGLRSVVHPDDVEGSDARWEETRAAGRHTDHELRMRRADGQYRWFLTRALPLYDEQGNIVRWYGTATDIEDRKRAEILLGGEKRLLEMIARGDSPALILDALCRLVEELASGCLSSILLLDPNTNSLRHGSAPSLPTKYTEAIDGAVIGPSAGSCGTAAYRRETVIVSDIATDPLWADYRELALAHGLRACWSTPILSSAGRVLGTFAIYYREPRSPTPRDSNAIGQITHLASIAIERKQREEALHQAQTDLARVSRVTTMGELTASLAHEVNQPITAAVTNAKTCVRWLAGDTPNIEEARDAAMRSAKNGTRAAEIISRIRLLFQKGTPVREPVDINEVIQEIIVLLRSEATRYSISVRTELGTELPELMGDSVQLQQVIMNLLLNGIEAMKDVDDKRELFIKSERWENEQVLVSVRDNGSGLPPQADQIFDAFFTTKLHGTGMGLSISRSIAESHGGRLWADGNSPHGATFHIALPARVEAQG